MYDVNVNATPPKMTPKTQAAFDNAMAKAQASADPRFNMKQMDRSGISRGQGTRAQAGIQAAQSLADGVSQAYQIPAQDAVTDAGNNLQYQQSTENFGLGAGSIGMQNDYANALAALQRQQNSMNFQGNVLSGLMGSMGNIGGGGQSGNISGWLDNFLGY